MSSPSLQHRNWSLTSSCMQSQWRCLQAASRPNLNSVLFAYNRAGNEGGNLESASCPPHLLVSNTLAICVK